MEEIKLFSDLNISSDVMKALDKMGLKTPTTIQRQAIPIMMDGINLIAKAPTGTGKTFAFGIPLLEYLNMKEKRVQDLIICPTRELALQISAEVKGLGQFIRGFKCATLIGGQSMGMQIQNLKKGPQIVVATPGRLLDHAQRNTINLSAVYTIILDEADEMLSMGFIKDIRKIMDITPPDKQIALFSATLSREVMDISWEYIHEAKEIEVEAVHEDLPQIRQFIISVPDKDKEDILQQIVKENQLDKIIVFCNTKNRVEKLSLNLKKKGYSVDCLHGDIPQRFRNRIMDGFRNNDFSILVATDVAARGIDVTDVEGVFNFDVPAENEYYLHRIGRTGRAKKRGAAYTFMSYMEKARMEEIQRYTKIELEELEF